MTPCLLPCSSPGFSQYTNLKDAVKMKFVSCHSPVPSLQKGFHITLGRSCVTCRAVLNLTNLSDPSSDSAVPPFDLFYTFWVLGHQHSSPTPAWDFLNWYFTASSFWSSDSIRINSLAPTLHLSNIYTHHCVYDLKSSSSTGLLNFMLALFLFYCPHDF